MKKLSHLLIAIIFFDVTSGFCQVTSFHGEGPPRYPLDGWSGHLKGNTVARTKDGKYVVGGVIDEVGRIFEMDFSGRPYLLKTSISGANAWQRVHLGDSAEYRGSIMSVREYGGGTVVAAGHINNGGLNHALFLKIDGRGSILAKKAFRLPHPAFPDGSWQDAATCIQVVRNASGTPIGTVLTGIDKMSSSAVRWGGFVHLTDGNGEPLASRISVMPARWVVQTADGFLVLIESATNELSVGKFSNDLTQLWEKAYFVGSFYSIHPATITQVGGQIYITGSIAEWDGGLESALLMQLNEDGTFNWAKTYGSNSASLSLAAKPEINGAGGLYLTGKIRNGGVDKAFILNTDLNGNRRWSRTYNFANAPTEGREIIATADSLVVTGVSEKSMLLIRTDLRGFSGVPCEYSLAMQVKTYSTATIQRTPGFVPPRYVGLEITRPLDKFNVTQEFCTTPPQDIGGIDPRIVIYPTVVTTLLNIELKLPSDAEGSVAVFDTYTKLLVQKIPAGASNVALDVSHLPPGLYYLLISRNGKETTSKFIKQ
jgi:hypothetical protein